MIDILYKDESVVVCLKRPGELSQAGKPGEKSLLTALEAELGGTIYPVHRLDREAGGVMVYSTCTLLPSENEEQVMAFLATHPEFSLTPFRVGEIHADSGMLTLTPDRDGTDGFFIAKLIKRVN